MADTLTETRRHVAAALREVEDAQTFTIMLPAHRHYFERVQAILLRALDASLPALQNSKDT